MKYTVYRLSTGEVVSSGEYVGSASIDDAPLEAGTGRLLGIAADPFAQMVSEAAVVDLDAAVVQNRRNRPNPRAEWDWTLMDWKINAQLSELKEMKWEEIKRLRADNAAAGFTFNGHEYDSDHEAIRNITGAVTGALVAQGASRSVSIDWTTKNNATVNLNGQQLMDLGDAALLHVNTQYAIARSLRQQIDAASSESELDAIVWPS
jgi:hypothetical protein